MKITRKTFYSGPNIYSAHTGLRAQIRFAADEVIGLGWAPDQFGYLVLLDRVNEALPTGVAGEAEAGRHGLYAAVSAARVPIAEHMLRVAAALAADFCVEPSPGYLIEADDSGFDIYLPCDAQSLAEAALALSIESLALIASELPATTAGLKQAYTAFRQAAKPLGLTMRHIALARAAHQRHIPCYRLPGSGKLFQFGQGHRARRVYEMLTDRTSCAANELTRDKFAVNKMLSMLGVPTPGTVPADNAGQAVRSARDMGGPVVVKPRNSSKGRGVCVGLQGEAEVRFGFQQARAHGRVVVERMVEGQDHRALLLNGRLQAVACRVPALIVGDGQRTVREQVDSLNHGRRRRLEFEGGLTTVELDDEAHMTLAAQGLTEFDVPSAGLRVFLRRTANISRGGNCIDLTEQVHPDNRELLERVARLMGVDVMGIDFITPDIGRSWRELPSAVIEVNAQPAFSPHLCSTTPCDVATPIVELLFPIPDDGRVPTIGVLGCGKSVAIVEQAARWLTSSGLFVAKSSRLGIAVGSDPSVPSILNDGQSARALMLDPGVQAVVFELRPRALLAFGMGIDACDVVVVQGLDHDSGDDLDPESCALSAAIIAARARSWVLLDAADTRSMALRQRLPLPRVCLVSSDENHPALRDHHDAGGCVSTWRELNAERQAVLMRDGMILSAIKTGKFDEPSLHAAAAVMALPTVTAL